MSKAVRASSAQITAMPYLRRVVLQPFSAFGVYRKVRGLRLGCEACGSAALGYRRGDRERARVSRSKCWNQYTMRVISGGLSPWPSLP